MKSKILICLIAIISIIIAFNEDKQDHNQYESDQCGYYIYLPAVFIYHDLGGLNFYSAVDKVYPFKLTSLYAYNDKKLDKYSIGVALFDLPYFLIAHSYCKITNQYKADGFTLPYQLAGIFSNIFVVILGLIALRKYLVKYYTDPIVVLTLVCIAFGTNLYVYTSFLVGMSHPYSFFLFAMLLLFTDRWHSNPKNISCAVILGITAGFIFLVRPFNIIVYALPLFWRVYNWETLKNKVLFFKTNALGACCIILSCLTIAFIQFSYWKYITGHWIVYSYQNESFDFLHPNIINGLISYRKGWFLYTPMALICFIGFPFFWRKNKEMATSIFIYMLVMIYLVFSWGDWYYGGGFSCRPMIEALPILSMPLAAMVEYFYKCKSWLKITSYFTILLLVIGLNLFQSYQYSMGLIHWSRMTKEFYWRIFGKVSYDRVANDKYLIKE